MLRSTAVACALLAWTPGALPEEGSAAGASEPFVWLSRYADGLRAALEHRRPFVVYLPPAGRDDDPQAVVRLPQKLGVPPLVDGVRATSDEVLELMERLRVKKLPALVLLDRRENIVAGWEGGVPSDVHLRLQAAVKKLEERDAKDQKLVGDARRLASSGNLEGAFKKVAPVLESVHCAPENLRTARAVEADLLAGLRRSAFKVLAGEGLRPDAELVRELEALRASTSHAGFQKTADRELSRLRGTTPGAR